MPGEREVIGKGFFSTAMVGFDALPLGDGTTTRTAKRAKTHTPLVMFPPNTKPQSRGVPDEPLSGAQMASR